MNKERKEFPYADVIVDISHESVDRPFSYRVPEHLKGKLEPGVSVLVPFGKGGGTRQGYVIALRDRISFEENRVKEIAGIAAGDMTVSAVSVRLAGWIREQYGSTMIAALKTVLPAKQRKRNLEKKEIWRLLSPEETKRLAEDCGQKHRNAMARLLTALSEQERIPMELAREKLHISSSTINSLEKQGALLVETMRVYRDPINSLREAEQKSAPGSGGICLSDAQRNIVDSIWKDYDAGVRKTYLIHGITGSGKTEVYMALIEE